ncbi:type II secretion system protein [Salmonella enterica subsp. enterica serovar Benin]
MVNRSAMKKKIIIKSRGFSLLEVIFVLAFLGIILATVATYARKFIDEKTRQSAADAVAQDIYGILQFVNADSITASVNNKTKNIINPLYQQPGDSVSDSDKDIKGIKNNPVWLIHPGSSTDAASPTVSPYIARTWSTGITAPVSNNINMNGFYSHSLKWSQAVWGANSVRNYFTDSVCQSPGTTSSTTVYFNQQFLSCHENPVLHNSEIAISRIDLDSDKGTESRPDDPNKTVSVGIDRVDVYISFTPVDGNPARIEQFITPLMTAFRVKKIIPDTDAAYLVESLTGTDNGWTLLNKTTGQPAGPSTDKKRTDLATISDLPVLVDKLQKGRIYAIRFTFDGKGDYLRTDGLNSATRLCWNTGDSKAGPCLTAPSQDSLVLKRRDNPKELASLQVSSVISTKSYMDQGKTRFEYYTAPQIQYAAFNKKGSNVVGPYYRNSDGLMCTAGHDCNNGPTVPEIADTNNGAISVPLQTCPVADGFRRDGSTDNDPDLHRLYPRLSAAVSSVVSGIVKVPPKYESVSPTAEQKIPDIFKNQSETMKSLADSHLTLNRLGGTVLQITQDTATGTWRIAGMVASENLVDPFSADARTWMYFNPSWLSVMITTWCSSEPQP